jgi:GNAT superfamily N-acetyltransferase
VEIRELTPERWDDLAALFGANGACGGCWCMWWRIEKGERWAEVKGATARRRMRAMVKAGRALGALAYVDGVPVGWVSYGPRKEYPRLDRAPSLRCADSERVWSVPCFFIRAGHRGQGVGSALLRHAVQRIRALGGKGKVIEGYPVRPGRDEKPLPGAFAWTGTRAMFDAQGFELAGNRDGGKQRVRRKA